MPDLLGHDYLLSVYYRHNNKYGIEFTWFQLGSDRLVAPTQLSTATTSMSTATTSMSTATTLMSTASTSMSETTAATSMSKTTTATSMSVETTEKRDEDAGILKHGQHKGKDHGAVPKSYSPVIPPYSEPRHSIVAVSTSEGALSRFRRRVTFRPKAGKGPTARKGVEFSGVGDKKPYSHASGSVDDYLAHDPRIRPSGSPHKHVRFGQPPEANRLDAYGSSLDDRTLLGSSSHHTSDLPAGSTPSWQGQPNHTYNPPVFTAYSPHSIPLPTGASLYRNLYSTSDPPPGFTGSYESNTGYNSITPEMVQDATLWFILSPKVLDGARLDSAARYPPPRCHPATRRTLRQRIIHWLDTTTVRDTNLLWLYGPAGVGKSAIAQTVAEDCRKEGWLGAAFFFSRSRGSDDPNRVIPSLVAQLFVTFPAYKALVSPLIIADPAILEYALEVQFQKLIVEPLLHLKDRRLRSEPLLLLLDGLDECQGDAYQQEFIRLISKFSALPNVSTFPFIWIVTSRSEWHICTEFSKFQCWGEELVIDTPEAREDVSILLRDGFTKIRNKYWNAFSEKMSWPAEEQLLVAHSNASGFIPIASAILQFIDTDEIPNPLARLTTSLSFLENPSLSTTSKPLDSLFVLYRKILQSIHPDILSITKKILFFLVLVDPNIPAQILANILLIDQATFYASLHRLHSVLIIPLPEHADKFPIRFYHSSFSIFLRYFYMDKTKTLVYPSPELCYVWWCDIWGKVGSNLSEGGLLGMLFYSLNIINELISPQHTCPGQGN
ncbi:hypothetical protein P691DRAFT_814806 [Macrolepiota fuliginosa MF-IS2]|uniref:NACHT domain-containing protein n=1 Tax=Macrolepiota fuliginosa MF-IS2 TaxID=1400762 RepID=A0A9P5WZ05_9AGAR|nr:hypothetical protein P691DRAFT_814806 [Macrolepiota fuliginosa MF-IS2]